MPVGSRGFTEVLKGFGWAKEGHKFISASHYFVLPSLNKVFIIIIIGLINQVKGLLTGMGGGGGGTKST